MNYKKRNELIGGVVGFVLIIIFFASILGYCNARDKKEARELITEVTSVRCVVVDKVFVSGTKKTGGAIIPTGSGIAPILFSSGASDCFQVHLKIVGQKDVYYLTHEDLYAMVNVGMRIEVFKTTILRKLKDGKKLYISTELTKAVLDNNVVVELN